MFVRLEYSTFCSRMHWRLASALRFSARQCVPECHECNRRSGVAEATRAPCGSQASQLSQVVYILLPRRPLADQLRSPISSGPSAARNERGTRACGLSLVPSCAVCYRIH